MNDSPEHVHPASCEGGDSLAMTFALASFAVAEGAAALKRAGTRCSVPECDGASSALTRQEKDALWQQFFTVAPDQRRAFEPNSKRRKRRPAPWPPNTASTPKLS